MKRRLIGLLILCLVGTAWSASRAAPRQEGGVTRTVLDNGTTVILQEDHNMPWASVNIFIRSGSLWEDDTTNGISHFSEHLFFRGTSHRTGAQIKQQIEGFGGQSNAETTEDFTHFFVNVPSVHVPEILDILSDCLINSVFDPKAIDLERQAVLDEFRMDKDSPEGVMLEKLYAMAYKSHPYKRSVIGTEANIKRWKQSDFQAWHNRYYVPERTAVVVVGDFDTTDLLPKIRALFQPLASTGVAIADTPQDPPMPQTVELRQYMDMRGAFALIGFRAPSIRDHKDIYATDLLTFLLGQGKDCLLDKAVAKDKTLVQSVALDFQTQRDNGLIILSIAAKPGRLNGAKTAALETISEVCDGKFSDQDLERARTILISTYSHENETDAGRASNLGYYEMIDKSDFVAGYLDGLRHVTRKDIIEAGRKYLDQPSAQLVVLPKQGGPTADGDADIQRPSTTVK